MGSGNSSDNIERAQEEAVATIAKCAHMANFLRKRLEIESAYAADLRKLCREYGLAGTTPLPQRHFPSFFSSSKTLGSGENPALVAETSLWRAFYDLIDDTSQMAKSHNMLAETMGTSVLEPLQAAVKSMEASRKTLVEQSAFLKKEQAEARNALKKALAASEAASEEAESAKSALASLQAKGDIKSRPLDKAKLKAQVAQERAAAAKQAHRQCEERLTLLLQKHQQQEAPRLLEEFRRQEAQRSFDSYRIVHCVVEIEKARMEVEEKAVREMEEHVRSIDLSADMQRFDALYGIPEDPLIATTLKTKSKSFNELSQQLIMATSELQL